MAANKLRLRDFIEYLKKSPLAVTLALIPLITLLLTLIYKIFDRPHVALVVLCGLGSVLLFAYNRWIVDARKSPRSKKRMYPKKLRVSVHAISFCVFLVCWVVVACMASNRRGGYVLLKLDFRKLAAKKLAGYLRSSPEDKIVWCWLALAKLEEEEHAEIEEVIRKGPTDADVCYWRARIYDVDGNIQEAVEKYKESFQHDAKYAAKAYPRYIAGLFKIAEEHGKDSDERLSQLERALDYANDAIGVAKSLKDESMLKEIQLLKSMGLNDLACTYVERGKKLSEAKTYINGALEIIESLGLEGPFYAYCLDTKAWIIIKKTESSNLGPRGLKYKEAEALLIKALKLLPTDDMNREHIKDHMRHLKRLLSNETNVP